MLDENIRNKRNIPVTLIIKISYLVWKKQYSEYGHYWKSMKWTLFSGSVFTTILIVSERKLYERKSRAFLQLRKYCNNRKRNSYFCSLPDKNWIVGFFWKHVTHTVKDILITVCCVVLTEWLTLLLLFLAREAIICHYSRKKMVKNDKLTEETLLLRVKPFSLGHVETLLSKNILENGFETRQGLGYK